MFTNKQHVTGLLAAGLSILYVAGAVASDASTKSKYAGQEQRAIKSLSANDVAELRRGGGWGLAKVAELNGVPGPIHLLEMKVQIQLSADQIAKITAIYESMRTGAMAPGGQLIELEGRLDKHFRDGTITEASLPPLLRRVSEVRAKLREVHFVGTSESSPTSDRCSS